MPFYADASSNVSSSFFISASGGPPTSEASSFSIFSIISLTGSSTKCPTNVYLSCVFRMKEIVRIYVLFHIGTNSFTHFIQLKPPIDFFELLFITK